MFSASILVLSLAISAFAAPSKRQSQSADNGSCRALQTTCAASVKADFSDVFNHKACIFGATCLTPVDGFLAAVHNDRGLSGPAPQSVNLPRVTTSVFNSISTNGKTVTQQNFIDGYYSSLDATSGPYPTDVQYVIDLFGRLQDWTAFCGVGIPFQNFADFFQYSSSVSSSNCGVTSTIIVSTAAPTSDPFPTDQDSSTTPAVTSAPAATTTIIDSSALSTAAPTSDPFPTDRDSATATPAAPAATATAV
ncbi:hypothetical protein PENSPDRAFT_577109 [Peniophora sp. CONT]|nr:hypothetical protein PENSPDRAFT_577109 [Peniophora sp. CONT]